MARATRNARSKIHGQILGTLERLHALKQHNYGSSWRKHGEHLSIMANVLRKADRLEVILDTEDVDSASQPDDETLFDTLADLAVYTMLYASWLAGTSGQPDEGIEQTCGIIDAALLRTPFGSVGECVMEFRHRVALLERAMLVAESDGAGMGIEEKTVAVLDLAAAIVAYIGFEREATPGAYAAWASKWDAHA